MMVKTQPRLEVQPTGLDLDDGSSVVSADGMVVGLRLNPGLELRPFKQGFRVWSPITRRELVWSATDVRNALTFSQAQTDPEPWRQLEWSMSDESLGATPQSRYFMMTERWRERGFLVEERHLEPAQLANVVYGDFTAAQLPYFKAHFGPYSHTVRLRDLPAYQLFVEWGKATPATEAFHEYQLGLLRRTYPLLRPDQVREQASRELSRYRDFYQRFVDDGGAEAILDLPLQVCRRPDGRWLLLDDSDRACAALALGYPVRVVVLDKRDYLGRISLNPTEFFGSMRNRMPYHSVYQNEVCLVEGVRTDLYQRLAMFRDEDLVGKRVLDLGSNIGMNGFLAIERGAVAALGIERSPELVATQARLNAYFGVPSASITGDLNEPIQDVGEFDTAFVLAVLGHLRGADGLLATLRNAAVKVVYFESHCDLQPQGEMEAFLGSQLFSEVVPLGVGSDNVFMGTATRKVYRCQVRR